MQRGLSLRIALLASAVVIAGLVGVAPAGASTVQSSVYGFKFQLPSYWTQIPLNTKNVTAVLKTATKSDPKLEAVLDKDVVAAQQSGLKVFAAGPVSGGFFPNVNVGVDPSGTKLTGQALVSALAVEVAAELDGQGVLHLTTATVHLAIGLGMQDSYQEVVGNKVINGIQLYIEHKSQIYVVTWTSTNLAQDQAVAHSIESSWHWL